MSIQSKPWHVYSKELQIGLYKVFVLFDQKSGSKLRVKFVKTVFQDGGKSEKIVKHENKEYHEDALERAKKFLESYEDLGTALSAHREQDSSNKVGKNSDTERAMQRGSCDCKSICNIRHCIDGAFRKRC